MDAPRDERPRATRIASGQDGQGETALGATVDPLARTGKPPEHNLTVTLSPPASTPEPQDTGAGGSATADGAAEPALLPSHTVVGRYIILGHLGTGGMGVVYKAYDPDLNRQIALKLVRVAATGGTDPASLRSRLLREAQGLAQLSHPNVVAVYDVGLFDDGVFLAMELVAGPTLRAWLKTEPSYRDKLRVFIAAGEGLAAAHRADLVHRDVKPDNVILGDDGRPRVLDFGLVRAVGAVAESPAGGVPRPLGDDTSDGANSQRGRSAELQVPVSSSGSLAVRGAHASLGATMETPRSLSSAASEDSVELGTPLTRVGSVLGTPRYMSLEQLRGRAVDAKSDQFSFCVALYEALYGKPPFRGKTLRALRDNLRAGNVRSAPAGVRVPARVRRAIVKGLAPDAEARHASMADLLAELGRDPAASRRRIALGLGLASILAVAAMALAQRGGVAERCRLDPGASRALWSATAGDSIGRAFGATGASHAADTAARVGRVLAQRSAAWTAMQRSACEATWIAGTQSEGLLDLRTECLAQRRAEQVSLIELFSQPALAVDTVDRAVEAASRLPAIAKCADVKALRSNHLPVPTGAADDIAAVREQLAEVRVRTLAGDYDAAVEAGASLVAVARTLDYVPLVGEATYEHAIALSGVGQFEAAQAALEDAMHAAAAGGDDHTAAIAASKWLWVVGYGADRANEALPAVAMARTLAARVPHDVAVHTDLHNSIGILLAARAGDYAAAELEFRRALELVTRAWGATDIRAARLHNNIGGAALMQGHPDQAILELTKALDLRTRSLGPDHPIVGKTTGNIGLAMVRMGRHEQAALHCREGLRVLERAHGPDHLEVARAATCLAQSLSELGELESAAEAAERSLRIRQQKLGSTHALVGESATALAEVRRKQGSQAHALALYERAVVAYEPADPMLVNALVGQGRTLVAVGREREGLDAMERAVAFASERELPSLATAEAALARVLWPHDRARARLLADRALAAFQASGQDRDHAALAAWLAAKR